MSDRVGGWRGVVFAQNHRPHGPPQHLGKSFVQIIDTGLNLLSMKFVAETDEKFAALQRYGLA